MRADKTCLLFFLLLLAASSASADTRCDVKRIIELDSDIPNVQVLSSDGEIVDLSEVIEAIVVPVRIDTGAYEVNVRRKEANLYEVQGKSLLIETRYCYEYSYGSEAILRIKSPAGFNIGELIFD